MPHWERGYRVWGYWDGLTRLGYVSLQPPGFQRHYICGIDSKNKEEKYKTLKAAKRWVERYVQ